MISSSKRDETGSYSGRGSGTCRAGYKKMVLKYSRVERSSDFQTQSESRWKRASVAIEGSSGREGTSFERMSTAETRCASAATSSLAPAISRRTNFESVRIPASVGHSTLVRNIDRFDQSSLKGLRQIAVRLRKLNLNRNDKVYVCDQCFSIFRSKGKVKRHRNRHVHDNKTMVAGKTGFDYKGVSKKPNILLPYIRVSKLTLGKHDIIYVCNLCNVMFDARAKLTKHKLCHAKKLAGKFDGSVNSQTSLVTDKTNHGTSTEGYFVEPKNKKLNGKCILCTKMYSSRGALKHHIKLQHIKLLHISRQGKPNPKTCGKLHKNYFCPKCPRIFRKTKQLKFHMKSHGPRHLNNLGKSGEKDPNKTCLTCYREYTSLNRLRSHITLHTREKYFKCCFCNKMFTWMRELETHMSGFHRSPKAKQCPVAHCGISIRPDDQRAHFVTEHRFSELNCESCRMPCVKQNGVIIHFGYERRNENHVCPTCSQSFKDAGMFSTHVGLHTAPFQQISPPRNAIILGGCHSGNDEQWREGTLDLSEPETQVTSQNKTDGNDSVSFVCNVHGMDMSFECDATSEQTPRSSASEMSQGRTDCKQSDNLKGDLRIDGELKQPNLLGMVVVKTENKVVIYEGSVTDCYKVKDKGPEYGYAPEHVTVNKKPQASECSGETDGMLSGSEPCKMTSIGGRGHEEQVDILREDEGNFTTNNGRNISGGKQHIYIIRRRPQWQKQIDRVCLAETTLSRQEHAPGHVTTEDWQSTRKMFSGMVFLPLLEQLSDRPFGPSN